MTSSLHRSIISIPCTVYDTAIKTEYLSSIMRYFKDMLLELYWYWYGTRNEMQRQFFIFFSHYHIYITGYCLYAALLINHFSVSMLSKIEFVLDKIELILLFFFLSGKCFLGDYFININSNCSKYVNVIIIICIWMSVRWPQAYP